MPADRSARVSEKRYRMKAPLRSKAKTLVTKARRLIADDEIEPAEAVVHEAVVALDKAAKKRAIHPKNAARRKSRLMSRLHKAGAS